MMGQMAGMPNTAADAILIDFMKGHQWQQMVDKIGKTMEIMYGYQCDTQAPDFKYQMKQLVRRVITTGVGFVRLNFSRHFDHSLNSTTTDDSMSMRAKRLEFLVKQIEDEKIQPEDARMEQVRALAQSLIVSTIEGDQTNIEERLEFDFPPSTHIIVDPHCRSLKGFIGAHWIAQQFIMPLADINAFFETDIPASKVQNYFKDGKERIPISGENSDKSETMACLYEIFHLDTKTSLFVVEGWEEYVQAPEAVTPSINRFWPIFSLTFNDVEMENNDHATIYPPSDVQLMKSAQKEWNRTREALREHRIENTPFYITKQGVLSEPDLEKLNNHASGEVISLQGLPDGADVAKVVAAFHPAPIDPNLYNTQPYEQDVQLAVGAQQANLGPAENHRTTATTSTIAEQSRISVTSSNVDDLDDLLSELARAGGEMMLREFSPQTVQRIVGPGAVWPQQNKEDFLNELSLDIVASSSGRPNKAMEISNFQQIAPLLLQAGANPWAVIKEAVNRLDDRLEVVDFAPIPQAPVQAGPLGQGGPDGPQKGPAEKPDGKPNNGPVPAQRANGANSGMALPGQQK